MVVVVEVVVVVFAAEDTEQKTTLFQSSVLQFTTTFHNSTTWCLVCVGLQTDTQTQRHTQPLTTLCSHLLPLSLSLFLFFSLNSLWWRRRRLCVFSLRSFTCCSSLFYLSLSLFLVRSFLLCSWSSLPPPPPLPSLPLLH